MALFRRRRRERAVPLAPGAYDAGGRLLTMRVAGVEHPLHGDFDAFAQDAAAGRISLLKTTFEDLFTDATKRLFTALAAACGPDGPQTRAVAEAPFACLGCGTQYPASVILIRSLKQQGGGFGGVASSRGGAERMRAMSEMTACITCGGDDAVWIYDPGRKAP